MRTFKFHILSKLEVLDDTRETKPTERMFAVEKFVWSEHLLKANGTFPFVFLNFNIQDLLFDLIECINVSDNFDFSETKLDLISQ